MGAPSCAHSAVFFGGTWFFSENTRMTPNPTPGQHWLAEGQRLLAQGNFDGAGELLVRARDEAGTRLAAHNLIEQHFPLLS